MVFRQVCVAVVVAAVVVGLAGAAPADTVKPQDSLGTKVGYFSYEPLAGDNKTVGYFSDQPLPEGEVTPVSGLPGAVQRQLAGRGVVAPRAGTPDGYKLRKGSRSTDYVYKSADV
jgi:hypothetical protein